MAVFCYSGNGASSCTVNVILTAYIPATLVLVYLLAILTPRWIRVRLRRSAVVRAFQPFVTPEEAYEIYQRQQKRLPGAFAYDLGQPKDDTANGDANGIANRDGHAKRDAKGKGRADERVLSNGASSHSAETATERTPLLPHSGASKNAVERGTSARRHTKSTLALCILSALQAGAWCVLLAFQHARKPAHHHHHHDSKGRAPRVDDATVLASGLVLLTWVYTFARIAIKPQRTPPYDLFVLFWAQIAGALATLYGLISDVQTGATSIVGARLAITLEALNLLVCAVAQSIIFAMPIALDVGDDSESSEEHCSLWNWTTFNWVNPLIDRALRGTIEKADLWIMPMTCRAAVLYYKFEHLRKSSLLRRLYVANSADFWKDGVLTVISVFVSYGRPFFIQQILRTIQLNAEGHPDVHRQTAYLYAFLVLLVSVIESESDVNHLYLGRRMTVRVKSELIAAIYAKALRRKDSSGLISSGKTAGIGGAPTAAEQKGAAKDENKKDANDDGAADVGKIVSIMAVDAQRVGDACSGFYQIWSAPVQLVIACIFLYQLLGLSAFVGCVSFLVFSPLQGKLMRMYFGNVKRVNAARDKRMTSLNELIGNLKIIRLCGWVPRWTERVLEQRKGEIKTIRYGKVIGAFVGATFDLVPICVAILSFASYVIVEKRELDTPTAFTALALFNILGGPISFLPIVITSLAETYTSLKRVENFLEEEDVPESVQSALIHPSTPFDERLGCDSATFRWRLKAAKKDGAPVTEQKKKTGAFSRLTSAFRRKKNASKDAKKTGDDQEQDEELKPFELVDVSLSCPVGKLTLVCGATGSGKSSLLSALLGEMDLVEGKVHLPKQPHWVDPVTGLNGRVAYCSQTPWLVSQSIKDNILFGSPFEQDRYDQVIEACALKPDLKVLVDGDNTEIGEKGTTLSGGQKARVALARALYSRTKTLLCDDILSALDAHSSSHIVDKALRGPLLKDRTVLLVSHHVSLVLPAASWVVQIGNGRIIAQGTPADMRASGELGELLHESEKQEEMAAEIQAAEEPPAGAVEKIDDAAVPAPAIPGKPKQLITEETRARGAVQGKVYMTFIRAYGYVITLLVVLAAVAVKVSDAGASIWLAKWTTSYRHPAPAAAVAFHLAAPGSTTYHQQYTAKHMLPSWQAASMSNASQQMQVQDLPPPDRNVLPWIGIYAAILLGEVIIKIIMTFLNFWGQLRASSNLFEEMLWNVVRASARWIETTPLGRILNRFSKDIEVLDGGLASNLRAFFMTGLDIVGAILIITFTVPPFLLPAIVILLTHYWIARGYMIAGRDLRRLESTLRSPIFSAFGELLQGISVVRAFGAEERYMATLCAHVDQSLSAHFYQWQGNRWLLLRFQNLGGLTIFITSILALSGGIPVGWAGVATAQALSLTQYVYWMCRFATATEQDLSSVERISEYLPPGIPSEKARSAETKPAPAYWPSNSQGISVEGLEFKYADNLDPVLHKISFQVKPGERIAVVGRTGSGKSTLALALLRFNEFSAGSIHIDGVDISTIDLDDLRSRLTLIPQDAIMFKGSVRENLDPFGEHDDATLIQTLQRCQLKVNEGSGSNSPKDSKVPSASASRAASVSGKTGSQPEQEEDGNGSDQATLSPEVARVTLDSGATLSQGQRQLLAMARSILRGSRVCIMDESTASLDFETDRLIQTMIRQEFEGSILITIAHRLSTVIDYDRVLVMEQGHIREYDTPYALLQNKDGVFYSMVARSGEAERLHAAAAVAHERKTGTAVADEETALRSTA